MALFRRTIVSPASLRSDRDDYYEPVTPITITSESLITIIGIHGKDLLRLESTLEGPPDLNYSHTEHTAGSNIERQYIRFCIDNRLYLHPCPSEVHEAYMDPLSVRFPIPGANEVFELISENLAQLKREYVTARLLLFSYKEKAPDLGFVERGLFLPSRAPCESTVYLQLLNLAFRSAYSILDKIAYFLNSYCRPGEKAKGV